MKRKNYWRKDNKASSKQKNKTENQCKKAFQSLNISIRETPLKGL